MFHPVWDKPHGIRPGTGLSRAQLPGPMLYWHFCHSFVSTGWKRLERLWQISLSLSLRFPRIQNQYTTGSQMSYSDDCCEEHVCSEEQSRIEDEIPSLKSVWHKNTTASKTHDDFKSLTCSMPDVVAFLSYAILELKPQTSQTPARPLPFSTVTIHFQVTFYFSRF